MSDGNATAGRTPYVRPTNVQWLATYNSDTVYPLKVASANSNRIAIGFSHSDLGQKIELFPLPLSDERIRYTFNSDHPHWLYLKDVGTLVWAEWWWQNTPVYGALSVYEITIPN